MEIGRRPAIPSGTAAKSGGKTVSATQTTLPQYQTVNLAAQSESVPLSFREVPSESDNEENEPPRKQRKQRNAYGQLNDEHLEEIQFDRNTSALIFRAIDAATGNIEDQYPEEARLKLNAYVEKTSK